METLCIKGRSAINTESSLNFFTREKLIQFEPYVLGTIGKNLSMIDIHMVLF